MAAAVYPPPSPERPTAYSAEHEPVRGHSTIHEIHCKTLLNGVRLPIEYHLLHGWRRRIREPHLRQGRCCRSAARLG